VAQQLEAAGLSCGLITNDQAKGLIDTQSAQVAARAAAVKQVAGGCFYY
jgi:hypothetical protein